MQIDKILTLYLLWALQVEKRHFLSNQPYRARLGTFDTILIVGQQKQSASDNLASTSVHELGSATRIPIFVTRKYAVVIMELFRVPSNLFVASFIRRLSEANMRQN